MKIFKFLLRESRKIVILAVFAGILSGASSTGVIVLINTALDNIGDPTALLIWGFIGLCLVRLISEIASDLLLLHFAQKTVFDLRMRLSRRILATPLRQLEELGVARLLATLTEDTLDIAAAITFSPLVCIDLAIVVGCLVYMGWLSWSLLLMALGFLVLGMVTYQLPLVHAGRFLGLAREEQDALFEHFRALTEGTKELKLHHSRRKAFLSHLLQSTAASFMRYRTIGMSIFRAAGAWGNLVYLVVIGLLIFVVPALTNVDTRTLTGYTLAILYTMVPIATIMNVGPSFGTANVALRKIESLGLSSVSDTNKDDLLALPAPEPSWERLELVGVTHSYHQEVENSSFTLGPIDLAFRSGELIFMGGGNGSGKTTLAKILTGLYPPEDGEIRLDGQPITDENREDYRQNFSVVFFDFYLFESLLGLDATELDAKAREYLAKLQLDHKVQIEDRMLSTTDLSQGQRKRLALLTAYLEDRPFYVFDEWAADQDPLFREIFYTQILSELKRRGKTVLVITHDDRYYYLADRLIKLDYGKVDYDGRSYDGLLSHMAQAELAD